MPDLFERLTAKNLLSEMPTMRKVAFPEKYTHAAMATARLCVANALNGANRRARDLVVPHCTYPIPRWPPSV
ncbi:hypothetical protein [Edaphobacter aggregans]|uniref:hypothetical protein n=1 Tax=Edaphobacter aggregans TaxID=570835 RepID=UPI0014704CDB|nr:hypothetical protein [Edaphobacter aggregans]